MSSVYHSGVDNVKGATLQWVVIICWPTAAASLSRLLVETQSIHVPNVTVILLYDVVRVDEMDGDG